MLHKITSYLIAFIWFTNGLFCKVFGMVPRHQAIVAEILGSEHAFLFTKLIGVSEVIMAIWIISKWKSKLNVILQCVVIATMNTIEFVMVPELLLWGRFNSVFALLLISIILWNARYSKQFEA